MEVAVSEIRITGNNSIPWSKLHSDDIREIIRLSQEIGDSHTVRKAKSYLWDRENRRILRASQRVEKANHEASAG